VRRIFSKTFVFFFIFLLFFIFYQSQSRASASYAITADPESNLQPTTDEARDYIRGDVQCTGAGCQPIVTENTKTVHITFTGLRNKEYIVCLTPICFLTKGNYGISKKRTARDNTLKLDVCADGEDQLKLLDTEDGSGQCNDENGDGGDYFWGRHVYAVALFASGEPNRIGAATFYVYQYYPKVTVSPEKPTPDDPIIVTITGTKRPHGRGNRNNYAVEIARQDDPGSIYSQACITVPNDPPVILDEREEGDYIIKINEQANEGNDGKDDCSAEFTYYWIKIKVRSEDFWRFNPNQSATEIIPDPNGTEMAGLTKPKKAPPPPCTGGLDDSGNCPKVKTALGTIETDPAGFIKSIFSLILGLSGGIALLLIIYSGYQLMASRGEPEALKTARDQLIAAIIGLIFIIFSLVILQIIGVDVLRIPGFGE